MQNLRRCSLSRLRSHDPERESLPKFCTWDLTALSSSLPFCADGNMEL